jgi:hypothetical protein
MENVVDDSPTSQIPDSAQSARSRFELSTSYMIHEAAWLLDA